MASVPLGNLILPKVEARLSAASKATHFRCQGRCSFVEDGEIHSFGLCLDRSIPSMLPRQRLPYATWLHALQLGRYRNQSVFKLSLELSHLPRMTQTKETFIAKGTRENKAPAASGHLPRILDRYYAEGGIERIMINRRDCYFLTLTVLYKRAQGQNKITKPGSH